MDKEFFSKSNVILKILKFNLEILFSKFDKIFKIYLILIIGKSEIVKLLRNFEKFKSKF